MFFFFYLKTSISVPFLKSRKFSRSGMRFFFKFSVTVALLCLVIRQIYSVAHVCYCPKSQMVEDLLKFLFNSYGKESFDMHLHIEEKGSYTL